MTSHQMRIIQSTILLLTIFFGVGFHLRVQQSPNTTKDLYHSGWIDLNKNGRMDVYENPKADIDKRIDDLLLQMSLEEKTCQTATLYGYNRVLKDELPTAELQFLRHQRACDIRY